MVLKDLNLEELIPVTHLGGIDFLAIFACGSSVKLIPRYTSPNPISGDLPFCNTTYEGCPHKIECDGRRYCTYSD